MPTTRHETPDFVERAAFRVRVEREITATPDEVFAVLADTPSWSSWFPNVTSAAWTSEPPHGVGSTRRVGLGAITFDEVFTIWDPGERWAFSFVATSIPIARAGVEVADIDDLGDGRCHVTYTLAIDPLLPIVRLLRPAVARGLRRGLAALEREAVARRSV